MWLARARRWAGGHDRHAPRAAVTVVQVGERVTLVCGAGCTRTGSGGVFGVGGRLGEGGRWALAAGVSSGASCCLG